MRRLFTSLVLFTALFHGLARSAPGPAAALFERDWQWRLEHHPEYATTLGERRYNDRLSDTSLAAVRARREHLRSMLEEARALDRAGLSAQEKLSLDLFVFDKERQLATLAFTPVDPQLLTSWDGLPVRLPRLVAQTPFATEDDYRNYVARLNALPAHVDGLIEQLREGVRSGWTAPKASVRKVPELLRALREGLNEGPLSRAAAPHPRHHRAEGARGIAGRRHGGIERQRRPRPAPPGRVRAQRLPAGRARHPGRLDPAGRPRLLRLPGPQRHRRRADPGRTARAGPEGSGAHPRRDAGHDPRAPVFAAACPNS